MNNVIKKKGGLANLKKKYYKQFLTKKEINDKRNNNNNSVNHPNSYNNNQYIRNYQDKKIINNNTFHNYNSEIINSYLNELKTEKPKFTHLQFERNKSSNYLLTLENNGLLQDTSKINSTKYNYNFNYFDNVENGILNKKSKSKEKTYDSLNLNIIDKFKIDKLEKVDLIKNENKDNSISNNLIFAKEYEYENIKKPKPIYESGITEQKSLKYYHDVIPKKYSYGGRTIIVSNKANNHSFKEIVVKSVSSDKIKNENKVVNCTEENINYKENFKDNDNHNCIDTEIQKNNTHLQTEINNEINYEDKIDSHKEIKKSISEKYLIGNQNLDYMKNYGYKFNDNTNDFTFLNDNNKIINNNLIGENEDDLFLKKYNIKYNINDNYINDNYINNNYTNDNYINNNYMNDYLLTYEKENKNNNIYMPIQTYNFDNDYNKIPSETLNNEKNELIYNYNDNRYKNINQNYKNKKILPKSYSYNRFNILKKNYSNTISTSKKSPIEDLDYDDFKLKVKLELLKKQIHKNRINLNRQQDKNYLQKILNNKKRKSCINDIVLEKTKKALEEKKYKKEKKSKQIIKNKKQNYKFKYEGQILFELKKKLLENNKKNSKFAIKPKMSVFK